MKSFARLLSAAAVFGLMLAVVASSRAADQNYDGKIKSASATQIVVTVADKDHTFKVDATSKITLDGKEAKAADLKAGDKVRGTTIAEFGAGNRVLDMIVYRKGTQEFLLTANNSRGVMKIPTATFATAAAITTPVETETGGVPFEKVTSMTGIEQLEKLDDNNSIVVARTAAGGLNLQVVPLP
jgi:hypothetical protein